MSSVVIDGASNNLTCPNSTRCRISQFAHPVQTIFRCIALAPIFITNQRSGYAPFEMLPRPAFPCLFARERVWVFSKVKAAESLSAGRERYALAITSQMSPAHSLSTSLEAQRSSHEQQRIMRYSKPFLDTKIVLNIKTKAEEGGT